MKPKVFFTSDWHLGHLNVITFDNRPFANLDHMHTALVDRYNSTVPEDGLCYFLGDMGFSKGDEVQKVMSRLNKSQKICIKGNHDKSSGWLKDLGFDVVLNAAMIAYGDVNITMSHCPLRGVWRESHIKNGEAMKGMTETDNWHGEHKHINYSLPDFGQFHLHGHTHKAPDERIRERQFDVGVRANNYAPVSMGTIESWIIKTKNRRTE